MPLSRHFLAHRMMSGPWQRKRPRGRKSIRRSSKSARDDALTDLDRILDDNDDVYIGLPSAAWLIYRELSRQKVTVSLDGHGADELMGAYLQEGQSGAFRLRNALAGLSSNSALARRGVDLLRALMIKRRGHYFLRGGLRDVPAQLQPCR